MAAACGAPAAALASHLISTVSQRALQQAEPAATADTAAAQHRRSASRHPHALDLRPINGLRALASITVVIFHGWLGLFLPLVQFDTSATLTRNHWFVSLSSVTGPLAVEFFLIVTAMLATLQLLPLLEGSSGGGSKGDAAAPSCRAVVLRYWRRRALRLLPAYVATNLLILLAIPGKEGMPEEAALARQFVFNSCPAGLWRNALFITNWDPLTQGCGTHLWSLSLQVQFYVAFPLLLLALRPRCPGFRARLAAALAAVFAAGTAWRLRQAFGAQSLHLPYGNFSKDAAELGSYVSILTAAYFPTGARIAELALGAALGLLLRSHAALSWVARRRTLLAGASLGLQAAFWHTQFAWSPHGVPGEALWQPLTARLYTALMYWGSPLVAATVAVSLLALMLHSDPLHSALASALSSPRFHPLSKLSYALYLIHEHARIWTLLYLVPAGLLSTMLASTPISGLVFLSVLSLAAAYACSYLLYELVERRF